MTMLTRYGGAWRECEPFVRDAGIWKPVDAGFVRDAGLWKEFYTGKELITEELASGVWVCPPGVTRLETLIGRGARGEDERELSASNITLASTPSGLNINTSTPRNWAQTQYNKFPSSGRHTITHVRREWRVTSGGSSYADYTVTDTYNCYPKSQSGNGWGWSESTTGGTALTFRFSGPRRYRPRTRGDSTTGFGEVFSGGLGDVIPSERTVVNVPVVPGQPYEISVNTVRDGFLMITYYG